MAKGMSAFLSLSGQFGVSHTRNVKSLISWVGAAAIIEPCLNGSYGLKGARSWRF